MMVLVYGKTTNARLLARLSPKGNYAHIIALGAMAYARQRAAHLSVVRIAKTIDAFGLVQRARRVQWSVVINALITHWIAEPLRCQQQQSMIPAHLDVLKHSA